MLAIKTNLEIGRFLEHSRTDNMPIRLISSIDDLKGYDEKDYEIIQGYPNEDKMDLNKLLITTNNMTALSIFVTFMFSLLTIDFSSTTNIVLISILIALNLLTFIFVRKMKKKNDNR